METREFLDRLPDRILEIRTRLRDLASRQAVLREAVETLETELTLAAELQVFDRRNTAVAPERKKYRRLTLEQQQEVRDSDETAETIALRLNVSKVSIWRVRRRSRSGPVPVENRRSR